MDTRRRHQPEPHGAGEPCPASHYRGGLDVFRKIVAADGLYRGFGMSILTYAPSNAVW